MSRSLRYVLAALLPLFLAGPAFARHGDIQMTRKGDYATKSYPPATFPHWAHRMQFKCYVCHDSIFHMKAGADIFTMNDINSGKYCGKCHNGKIAFAPTFSDCQRCHR